MKKYFAIAAAMLLALPSFAQITEGEPSATTIKTGNRPEKGTWGVFVGAKSNTFSLTGEINGAEVSGIYSNGFKINAMPLINIKYMLTDKLEARVGLDFSRSRDVERLWSITDTNDKGETTDSEHTNTSRTVKADNKFIPGIAYHWTNSNILDVYAGAELPIGWTRNTSTTKSFAQVDVDGEGNLTGPYYETSTTNRNATFQIGLGAFIGMQVFVANLPIALGVEYGLTSMVDLGRKSSMTQYNEKADATYKYQFREASKGDTTPYDKVRCRRGEIGNQVRFTLSYYFK